jgi:hypothetical protein
MFLAGLERERAGHGRSRAGTWRHAGLNGTPEHAAHVGSLPAGLVQERAEKRPLNIDTASISYYHAAMRGDDEAPDAMFSYVSPEDRIPRDQLLMESQVNQLSSTNAKEKQCTKDSIS